MKKILSYTVILPLILALALLGRVIYKQTQNEKALQIRDYVSMAELQSFLNKGLELETLLVEIYEKNISLE